jgi:hypothetical protein
MAWLDSVMDVSVDDGEALFYDFPPLCKLAILIPSAVCCC